MKKKILIILLVLCVFYAFAEGSKEEVIPNVFLAEEKNDKCLELVDVLKQFTISRQDIVLPEDYYNQNISQYMDFSKYYKEGLSKKECRQLQLRKPTKASVTKNEMKEDIELYFRALRYAMGRYDYFGGDPVFNKAKQEILAKIDAYPRNSILTQDVEKIVGDTLSFITDCHFIFGTVSPFYDYNEKSMVHYSYTSGILLGLDENGFYEKNNPHNRYISCDCEDAFVSHYLESDGSLSYSLILYTTKEKCPKRTSVVFSDGLQEVQWEQLSAYTSTPGKNYVEKGNIAYVDLSNDSGDGYGGFVVDFANRARRKDIVIIDLRCDGSMHCYDFLSAFTSKKVACAQVAIERQQMLSQWEMEKGQEKTITSDVTSTGKTAAIPNLVIILTDQDTGCASEEFSQYFKMFDYAFVVGSNTHGHLDGGSGAGHGESFDESKYNLIEYYLPNSGIEFRMSNAASFFNDFESRMGKGWIPDFYVENTSTALSSVLNLLVNCNLTESETAKFILEKSQESSMVSALLSKEPVKENEVVLRNIIDNDSDYIVTCTCGNSEYVFRQPCYCCTKCGKEVYHEDMMGMVEGIWHGNANEKDFVIYHGKYDSPDKVIGVDGKLFHTSSSGNWYKEMDKYACLEFLGFNNDENAIFMMTISKNRMLCDMILDGNYFSNVVFTRE